MEFKVGDKVKVIKCDTRGVNCENLNKVSTITEIDEHNGGYPYVLRGIEEYFGEKELELLERQFTKSDLKDGDKCTLKNGQVVFVDKTSNYGFSSIDEQLRYFNDDVSIVKVERPAQYETVFERKEEILDETEKRYLASVIKPFKNKIETIEKTIKIGDSSLCYLNMLLKNNDMANLPDFKKNSMYKGMEVNRKYTLKELGL